MDDVGFVYDVQSRRSYIDTAEDVVAHLQGRLPSSRESDTCVGNPRADNRAPGFFFPLSNYFRPGTSSVQRPSSCWTDRGRNVHILGCWLLEATEKVEWASDSAPIRASGGMVPFPPSCSRPVDVVNSWPKAVNAAAQAEDFCVNFATWASSLATSPSRSALISSCSSLTQPQ